MNIQELQSFNLADAAKFHFRLNPKLWGSDENLLPEVKTKLLEIAEDFRQFLGVPELDVKDITISGSNAAYSYTDKSDIDLHLVVEFPKNKNSEIYRELFNAKKFQYNKQYDYKIGDADVELYVQDANEQHHSQGIYSLLGDKWVRVPRRVKADVDDISVKHKYEDWGHKIEQALASNNEQELEQTLKRLKDMRAAGLQTNGEFGVENLTFKLLRNNNLIQQLFDAYHQAKSERLSLEELQNPKPKKKFTYGYSEDVGSTPDGVDASTCQFLSEKDVEEDASSNPNGVSSGTNMFLDDQDNATPEQHLKDFVRYCQKRLGLNEKAVIKLRRDPEWSKRNKTFGRFNPNIGALEVAWGNRHIMDVFRTVAHELTHQRQNEVSMQPEDAGDTGSEWENQANALAGVLMREWGQQHPEMFDSAMIQAQDELDEGALSKAAAALAMSTALGMGNTAQAQSVGDALRAIQNIGTAAKTASGMTRAGINAEAAQELMNYIRAQGGDPHGQNKSTLYQWQKRMEQDRQAKAQDSQPVNDKYLDDYRTDNNRPARYYQQPNPAVNESKITLYTVNDFAVNEFNNFFEYRRWHSKAKESNRGATRYWPDKYSNLFVNTALVESSNNFHENLKLSKKFSEALKTTDLRDLVSIKVGGKIAVISTLAVPSEQGGRIELSGFVKPKTIVKINLDNQDKIDEIEFDNGDKFPEAAEFTTVGGANITTTAFYPDHKSASRAYTIVWMESSKLGGKGWTVENYMSDSVEIQEGASGYIPTKKQAKDPRYSMALTVDIKPGQVGKEANKLKLKTDSQGHPQIARADGLFEQLMLEYKRLKAEEDYSPDEPPGPEFKPTMPAGTLRVDVSDMYDWYKLGQHISGMKGLGQHDFGAGPPSTVISFGDEDTEHKFIDNLKATGLNVTDIDPADLKKRPGKTIKTDPTYNVDESFFEDVGLDEVKMSPSALEQFANSEAAKGIRAGFEAELIFRDTQGDDNDEGDLEPDYDADERAYSIQQVIEFFQGGEYGGLSAREESRLQDGLDETYFEWRDEQMMSDFRNDVDELVREQWLEERPMEERIRAALVDGMELSDEDADRIIAASDKAPVFTRSSDQQEYAQQNKDYELYLQADRIADDILDEDVEQSIEKQDEYYDQALDNYRDSYSGDDDSFFSDVGLRWMSDVAEQYNLDWPYYTGGGRQNEGSRSWEDIGAELQEVIGMPVKVSSSYHSATRKEGQWIIEPDGSLDPDDRSEEMGLEIVSPPMPLLQTIEKLKQLVDWANSPEGGNAYTNSSTGLHMGVSLPVRGGDVDYVKLILFMGDKYVLEKFGRSANTYTASAFNKIKQNLGSQGLYKASADGVIKLLQHGLTELAYKELQKGVGTSKYTSAHLQNGYIEFRSPGGDWLAKADEEIGVLENTMMRFARAMAIAGDPGAERQEYAKKLYKMVTADNEQYADQLRLFSEYSAGTIDKQQLKKHWAEKTIGKEKQMNQRWKLYQNVNGTWTAVSGAEWNNYSEDQVKNAVWSKYGREALDSGEYKLVNMGEQEWEVYDVNTGKTLEIVKGKNKGEAADAVYDKYVAQKIGFNVRPYEDPAKLTPRAKLAKRIVDPKQNQGNEYEIINRASGQTLDGFRAATTQQADQLFSDWLKERGLPDDTEDVGYRVKS